MAPHRLIALLDHLLANRHRIPNRLIIACLVLARFNPDPSRRYGIQELMKLLDVSSQPYLSQILVHLAEEDLISYERGGAGDPGYLFRRIGPEVMP